MDNVPVNTNSPTAAVRNVEGRHHTPGHKKNSKSSGFRFIAAIAGVLILVILLVFGVLFLYKSSTVANIDSDKYQAVFFTNGQVYFGKLKSVNGSYMKLTDIYYLQSKTNSASTDSENLQETANDASGVELIKLGSEIHGPDDEMVISRDQILFFENLKKDGKVAESIGKYQTQNK